LAFPSANEVRLGDYVTSGHAGLTKREWYAGLAMQAMLNSDLRREQMATTHNIAKDCFKMADAMLALASDKT
jgi:hypothetical protein